MSLDKRVKIVNGAKQPQYDDTLRTVLKGAAQVGDRNLWTCRYTSPFVMLPIVNTETLIGCFKTY